MMPSARAHVRFSAEESSPLPWSSLGRGEGESVMMVAPEVEQLLVEVVSGLRGLSDRVEVPLADFLATPNPK